MRLPVTRDILAVVVLALLLPAATSFAGDPVPDVDVILEQIPGGELMRVEETTGHRFDRVEFEDLPRDFVRAMDGAPLPEGWELRKEAGGSGSRGRRRGGRCGSRCGSGTWSGRGRCPTR